MRVLTKVFRATFKSWGALFEEAARFATSVGREHVIAISHSAEHSEGIVVVWYWGEPEQCTQCGYSLLGNTSGRCLECGLAC